MIVRGRSPPVDVTVCQITKAIDCVIRDWRGPGRKEGNLIGMGVID